MTRKVRMIFNWREGTVFHTTPFGSIARPLGTLLALALLTAACNGEAADEMTEDNAAMDGGAMQDDDMQDMDGMAMGDMAEITVAAEAQVDALPPEPLGWVAYQIDDAGEDGETYAWGPAFLYAEDEARTLEVDGTELTLQPGESVFVDDQMEHTAPDGSLWAFVLTDPDADAATGLEDANREFDSGPLEGLPEGTTELRFLLVDLPPEDGQTSVHTHPGPEFIYVAQGQIDYETGLDEATELTEGDEAALPADTAVQKRNVSDQRARFWSWFIVDPDEPFAPEATFDR